MRKWIVATGIICLSLLTYGNGFAESAKQAKHPCNEDAQKFCKDVKPGEGRIIACMENHKKELSAACLAHIEQVENNRAKHPCHEDVEKFCKNIKPGDGRIKECIESHKKELSPRCTEHMNKIAIQKK